MSLSVRVGVIASGSSHLGGGDRGLGHGLEAQVRARRDPSFPGYDTYLDDRMRAVLPACIAQGVRIVSNQGWINPRGAAARIEQFLADVQRDLSSAANISTRF